MYVDEFGILTQFLLTFDCMLGVVAAIKLLGETSLHFVHFFILIDDGRAGLQIYLSFIFYNNGLLLFFLRACVIHQIY